MRRKPPSVNQLIQKGFKSTPSIVRKEVKERAYVLKFGSGGQE